MAPDSKKTPKRKTQSASNASNGTSNGTATSASAVASKNAEQQDQDPITEEDHRLIKKLSDELKLELEDYPEYATDRQMQRWLIAWNRDMDVIVPKARTTIDCLKSYDSHKRHFTTVDEVKSFLEKENPLFVQHYPGVILSDDCDGDIVLFESSGRTNLRGILTSMKQTEFYRMNMLRVEAVQQLVRRNEARTGRRQTLRLVVDCEGIKLENASPTNIKSSMSLISLFQTHFPELISVIYIINLPKLLQFIIPLLEQVMATQAKRKIRFLGDDWKEKLGNDIGRENLYPHWGGTKYHPDGEFGDIPRKVPKPYKLDVPEIYTLAEKRTISMGARDVHRERVVVQRSGQRIRWFFKLHAHDIDFYIVRLSDGREIFPKLRIITDYSAEFGERLIDQIGQYDVVLDNSFSRWFGRKFDFFCEVVE